MPSSKKRKVIDCEWVDTNIIANIPPECLEKVEALRTSVESWKQEKEVVNLPTVR